MWPGFLATSLMSYGLTPRCPEAKNPGCLAVLLIPPSGARCRQGPGNACPAWHPAGRPGSGSESSDACGASAHGRRRQRVRRGWEHSGRLGAHRLWLACLAQPSSGGISNSPYMTLLAIYLHPSPGTSYDLRSCPSGLISAIST